MRHPYGHNYIFLSLDYALTCATSPPPLPVTCAGPLVFTGSLASAMSSIAPLLALVQNQPTLFYKINATFTPYASFDDWHSSIDNAESGDRTGDWESLGSRLLPMAICENDAVRGNTSAAMAQV
jgi:hypothetical protein